jgi:hypothetical protein
MVQKLQKPVFALYAVHPKRIQTQRPQIKGSVNTRALPTQMIGG